MHRSLLIDWVLNQSPSTESHTARRVNAGLAICDDLEERACVFFILAAAVLGLLMVIGPLWSAYRTNEAFAVCWEDAGGQEFAGEEFFVRVVECKTQHCSPRWEPSRLEKAGLFLQTRLSGNDGPSCVDPPEVGDILLPWVRDEPDRETQRSSQLVP